MVSALETSANLHLKPILKELEDVDLYGIYDESLGEPLYPTSSFNVMGFIDVVSKISLAKKAINQMALMSFEVDTVLLIDSPAFNLPLAKAIKKINPSVKIVYYILPQVWAWKAKRVKKVEKYCDYLASILPFEKQFYSKATYVGHPLLDEIQVENKKTQTTQTVAFLAGSRKSEIKKLMPYFREVAKQLKTTNVLVVPPFLKNENLEEMYGDVSGFKISYEAQETLSRSDFAYICSGTATLESALIGTPFVLVYKAKWLDYLIAKTFVRLSHVGLANIIFDFASKKPLHVELLQNNVNTKNLLHVYKSIDVEKFKNGSKQLKTILQNGAAKNVASMIQKTL